MREPSSWMGELSKTTPRQLAKDRLMMRLLKDHFIPGSILEIGAGLGRLSRILAEMGFDVIASDYETALVEYMQNNGIRAVRIDATRIRKFLDRNFDNVLCSSISTFIYPDLGPRPMQDTYAAVYDILNPGGKFVVILGTGNDIKGEYTPINDHFRAIRHSGLSMHSFFRNQLLPSPYYGKLPAGLLMFLEKSLAGLVGHRYVMILEKKL